MKLIHTSDLHLDSPLTSRLSPSKARERRRELIGSFRAIIEDAKRIDAGGIIIAGDLFDSDAVGVKTLETVIGIIESAPEIRFFYLPGNHEGDRLTASGLAIPKNLFIFGKEWTYYDLDDITIAGCSDIREGVADTLKLSPERKNILVLHGELSEKFSAPDKIGKRELSELPVDYVALGHYHSYSETAISDRCVAVYSGTPEGRGFDEAGDCGYSLIDISYSSVSSRLVRRSLRAMRIVKVDLTGAMREIDIENRVSEALIGISENDLIRVVLTGEYEPGLRRDTELLCDRFRGSFYYFEIKDESRLRISSEDYVNDKSLKGEVIRLVMSQSELSREERDAIIECGLRALAGESI